MPDGMIAMDDEDELEARSERRGNWFLRFWGRSGRPKVVESRKDRVWRLLESGIIASKSGDLPSAQKYFKEACDLDPRNKIALEMAAFAANRANDWDSSYEYWTRLGDLNEGRSGPQRHRLNALVKSRRWDEARTLAERLIEEDPKDVKLRTAMVELSIAQGDIPASQQAAEAAHEADGSTDVAERLMELYLSAKLPVDAERWTRAVEGVRGETLSTILSRARIAYITKDFEAAQEQLDRLEDEDELPEKVRKKASALYGRIAVNQGQFDEATKHFNATLELDPENAEAISYLVGRKLVLRRFDEAQALLVSKGWHQDPVQAPIWDARRRVARDDVKGGIRILTQAVENAPDRVPLVVALIELKIDTGDLQGAREVAERYRNQFGKVFDVEEMLFRIALAQDWSPEGKEQQAREVLALNPRNTSLLNALGTLMVKEEKRADAAEHYVASVETAPNSAMLWRNGAYHLRMIDQMERAADFARASEQYFSRSNAEDAAELAAIYRNAGMLPEAVECAETGLIVKPSSRRVNEIAAELSLDQGQYDVAAERLGVVADHPERKLKITVRAAKVQTAFRTLERRRSSVIPLPSNALCPEALFDLALEISEPDYSPERKAVVNVTGSLAGGGAERQVTYSMQGFMARPEIAPHNRLIVDSLDPSKARDFYLKEVQGLGCPVICLEDTRQSGKVRNFIAEHPELREKIQLINAMPPEISRYALPLFVELTLLKPRVVHLWQDMTNMSGGLACMLAGVPRVIIATRNTRPLNQRRLRRYMIHVYHTLRKYEGTVCINNSGIGARDYEEWLGWEEGAINVLYNGYDFSLIQKKASQSRADEIRADLGIPKDALVVGGAMRFATIKRPDMWVKVLTDAISKHDNIYGVLCGDGPMRDTLLKEVEEAGLSKRIILAGRQSPIEPWMKMYDMFFLSSITEGLPNVLVESQAIGTPIATMPAGGAPEAFVQDESGILLPEGAPPEELSRRICELLTNKERLDAFAAAAPEVVTSRFGQEAMIERTLSFYF
ncbi:MAG: glycosyltransferase [Neomegalonema sp.]|nr:glycosyltransferase [Neomegalonema sp.]